MKKRYRAADRIPPPRIIQVTLLSLIFITLGMIVTLLVKIYNASGVRTTGPGSIERSSHDGTLAPGVRHNLVGDYDGDTLEVWFDVESSDGRSLPSFIRIASRTAADDRGFASSIGDSRSGPAIAFSGQTDSQGRIALVLPQGDYRFRAVPDDPRFVEVESDHLPLNDGPRRSFTVRAKLHTGSIRGRVLEESTRKGVHGIRIVLDEGGRLHREVFTDPQGSFEFRHLSVGRHRLNLDFGRHSRRFRALDERSVVIPRSDGDAVSREVTLVLSPACWLSGRVALKDGQAAIGLRVQAESAKSSSRAVAAVDRDGTFELTELEEGPVVVRFLHPWSNTELREPVKVDLALDRDPEELRVVLDVPQGHVRGEVLSDRGEPISGAVVEVYALPPAPPIRVEADEQGHFAIERLWPGDYPIRTMGPEGSSYSPSREIVTVEQGPSTVELRLSRKASLVVLPGATWMNGPPNAYAVEVTRGGEFSLEKRFGGEAGKLLVEDIPPGRVQVTVRSLGKDESVLGESTWSVDVRPGTLAHLDQEIGLIKHSPLRSRVDP